MANASIFGIIVGKFHHEKKPYPIILLKVDKSLEISFYYAILPFGPTIYLWVEGSGKFPFDFQKIA